MTEAPELEGPGSTQSGEVSPEDLKIIWEDLESALSILREIIQEKEDRRAVELR